MQMVLVAVVAKNVCAWEISCKKGVRCNGCKVCMKEICCRKVFCGGCKECMWEIKCTKVVG